MLDLFVSCIGYLCVVYLINYFHHVLLQLANYGDIVYIKLLTSTGVRNWFQSLSLTTNIHELTNNY